MIESIESKSDLCTSLDDFLDEKTIWIATLSNNEVIYQDDDRPGRTPNSAWLRLGVYLKKKGLTIKGMAFKFRSHHENLPAPIDGAYFSKAILGNYDEDTNIHFYIYGSYEKGKVTRCVWYRVPEIVEFDARDKCEKDLVEKSLIKWVT